MSASPAPPPAEDPKASVLAAIDWELGVLGSRQTVLGATAWTITAALAGTLWLLSSRQHAWSELPMLCLLILGISLAYQAIAGLFTTYRLLVRPVPGVDLLVPFEQLFRPTRPHVVLFFLTSIGFAVCLWIARASLSRALLIFLAATLGIRLLLAALLLLFGHITDLTDPGKNDKKPPRLRAALVALLQFAITTAPAAWLWTEVLSKRPTIMAETARSAALVCVALALAEMLLMCQAPVPLIDTLQSLRRGVALDLLSPAEARSQVQIAVVGLRKEVVFQQALADLIAAYQPVLTGIDESIAWLERERASVEARTDWTADELEQKRRGYIDEFHAQADRLRLALARVQTAHDGLHRQARSRYGVIVGDELTKTAMDYFKKLEREVHRRADTDKALASAIAAARQRIESTTETSRPQE